MRQDLYHLRTGEKTKVKYCMFISKLVSCYIDKNFSHYKRDNSTSFPVSFREIILLSIWETSRRWSDLVCRSIDTDLVFFSSEFTRRFIDKFEISGSSQENISFGNTHLYVLSFCKNQEFLSNFYVLLGLY